jgi:hypothetical protein
MYFQVIGMWSYDEEELARICEKLQIPYSTTDIDVANIMSCNDDL